MQSKGLHGCLLSPGSASTILRQEASTASHAGYWLPPGGGVNESHLRRAIAVLDAMDEVMTVETLLTRS